VYRDGSFYDGGITCCTDYQNEINVVAGRTYRYFIRARNAAGYRDSIEQTVYVPLNVCP
jgi:hypothetical protein